MIFVIDEASTARSRGLGFGALESKGFRLQGLFVLASYSSGLCPRNVL